MSEIRERLRRYYPSLETMPYCAALARGEFDRAAVLRAEVVELYRALHTRARAKAAYAGRLAEALSRGELDDSDVRRITGVIEDEEETHEHADHLDLRLQIFASAGWSRAVRLRPQEELDAINAEWLGVLEGSGAMELIAVHAALEDWYAPVAGFFEEQYLRRELSPREVETYQVHREADVWHGAAGFEVLERRAGSWAVERVVDAVARTFETALAYDAAKVTFARRSGGLGEFGG